MDKIQFTPFCLNPLINFLSPVQSGTPNSNASATNGESNSSTSEVKSIASLHDYLEMTSISIKFTFLKIILFKKLSSLTE